MGRHWNEEIMKGYEEATRSDPSFLKTNNIETIESAPYGKVESSMGRGLINPIWIKPILNKLKLATPRMLETFAQILFPSFLYILLTHPNFMVIL